jgi:hypothetical protein
MGDSGPIIALAPPLGGFPVPRALSPAPVRDKAETPSSTLRHSNEGGTSLQTARAGRNARSQRDFGAVSKQQHADSVAAAAGGRGSEREQELVAGK